MPTCRDNWRAKKRRTLRNYRTAMDAFGVACEDFWCGRPVSPKHAAFLEGMNCLLAAGMNEEGESE